MAARVRTVEAPRADRRDAQRGALSEVARAQEAGEPGAGDRVGAALTLQRAMGNQAYTRLIGADAGAPQPGSPATAATGRTSATGGVEPQRAGVATTLDVDEEAPVSPVWDDLTSEFFSYVVEMARVNQAYPTVARSRWSEQFAELWSHVGDPGERTDAELDQLWDAFIQMQGLFADEYRAASDSWEDLQQAVAAERAALVASDHPADRFALEILDDRFQQTAARVAHVGGHLVPEDIAAMHHVLANSVHIDLGTRAYQRDLDRQQRLEAQFAEEPEEEEPGVLGTAWAVVGWDSWGEFAADVALTVVTGGIGKIARIAVKGTKAARRLSKLKALAKVRQARKAERAQKVARGVTAAFEAVGSALDSAGGVDSVAWVGRNWRKIARAWITDEFGEGMGGGKPTDAKNVLERVSKEVVGEYVSKAVGVSSSDEATQLKAALYAFAAGLDEIGAQCLRRYFLMNLKRRLASNAVYYGLRVGVGETKMSADVVVDVAASTSFEMAQDFITRAIPMGKPAEFLVESVRKSLQKWTADLVKGALG